MSVIAQAIGNARSTTPEDIRKAILSLRDWRGVEGMYNFDENGDGLRGYNVVKNDKGKVAFVKHVSFDK